MKKEAMRPLEMSVRIFQTTRRHIQKDSSLHSHRRGISNP